MKVKIKTKRKLISTTCTGLASENLAKFHFVPNDNDISEQHGTSRAFSATAQLCV